MCFRWHCMRASVVFLRWCTAVAQANHCMLGLFFVFLFFLFVAGGGCSVVMTRLYCLLRHVRMAYLAVVASHTVNGVAAIHSDIIRNTIFKACGLLHPPAPPATFCMLPTHAQDASHHPSGLVPPQACKVGATGACQKPGKFLLGAQWVQLTRPPCQLKLRWLTCR